MLIGALIHTLLQGVLKIKTANALKIEDMLHKLLSTRSTVKTMYNCSLSYEELKTEMMQFVPQIIKFMENYVLQRRNPMYLVSEITKYGNDFLIFCFRKTTGEVL